MYHFNPGLEAACQIGILGEIYEQHIGYKTDGFFVEIGAFDGYSWSNTLPLIDAGWRGIMVEPDPTNFALLSQRYWANNKLTLVQAAINDQEGVIRLYPGSSSSTIVEAMIQIFRNTPGFDMSGMTESRYVYVVGYTMDDVLEKNNCPARFDVLSIDVEGAELAVLHGYDIDRHRPKLAIVEMDDTHWKGYLRSSAKGIRGYFGRHGYERIYDDHMNTIFLDKRA